MLYFIETYGCQMNKAESAALERQLVEHGWKAAQDAGTADLVLINTCSVRITAENRAWGRINYYASLKRARPFYLMVTGCMGERLKADMRIRQPAVDYVLGNFQKQSFGLALDAMVQGKRLEVIEESPSYAFAPSHLEPGAFRSFLPIMHGCDNFCTYCIVPYVRGRETSRDPQAILGELDDLAAAGIREVTLLGQNVNSYRWSGGGADMDFPTLLETCARRVEGSSIRRLRFLSSHPKDLSDRTMDVLAAYPVFGKHIHLCAQHGSNRVLKAMNRRYTREYYLGLVQKLRSRIPDLSLSTDILIGFPGETEEDVELTLELMREVRFAYSFMYHFNPREGTPAAVMDGALPDAVKKERLARVIALQKTITRELMASLVGTEADVLVEGVSTKREGELLARSDLDMMVVFPGEPSLIGQFAKVRLDSLRGVTFKGTMVPGDHSAQ